MYRGLRIRYKRYRGAVWLGIVLKRGRREYGRSEKLEIAADHKVVERAALFFEKG
jgi:hypothetical protein